MYTFSVVSENLRGMKCVQTETYFHHKAYLEIGKLFDNKTENKAATPSRKVFNNKTENKAATPSRKVFHNKTENKAATFSRKVHIS